MAFSLHLAERLSPIADIPHGLAMSDGIFDSLTPSETMLVFWRFEDEANKEPQFLGSVPVNKSFDFPLDLKGRPIRGFGISVDKNGVPATRIIYEGVQFVFDPGAAAIGPEDLVIAGESLVVNDLLYIYLDSGITKAKKADATDATKPAQAFAVENASTSDPVRIFLPGNTMTGLLDRTSGAVEYLDTTPGQMTETPPTGMGNLIQRIGVAQNSTTVDFHPQTVGASTGTPPDGGSPPSSLTLTDLGASGGNESIQLDWTNNGGLGDNVIERNLDGAGYATLTTVSSSTATYTDSAHIASGGLLVSYRVRNASVTGYSNEIGINAAGTPPTGLHLTQQLIGDCDWDVLLSWTNGTGSGDYTLESKIGIGGSWSTVDSSITGTTSYDDTQSGSTTSYIVYYRIKQNDVTGYSNEVHTTIPRCIGDGF